MATYSVRCRNYKCRHRRVTKRHPDDYKRVPKCGSCGERKGWRIEQRQYSKRDRCHCSGYHYPHQKGSSRFCDHHPEGAANQNARYGTDPGADMPLDGGRPMNPNDECPF